MKKLISIFRDINYKELNIDEKVKLLDKIERLYAEMDKIYKYNLVKVKGFEQIYISRDGRIFNSLSNSFITLHSKNRTDKTFKASNKTHSALQIFYKTFIGDIPEGAVIHSKSNKFLFEESDLYLSDKGHFEASLTQGETFVNFKKSKNFYITSKGRVYSKIVEKYLPRRENNKTLKIELKHYSLEEIMLEHFFEDVNSNSQVIYLDNNPTNISVENMKIVPCKITYWLKNNTEFKEIMDNKYIITKEGFIYSFFNNIWLKLKISPNPKGYIVFKYQGKSFKLHRLIYEHFIHENIEGYEINHIDGDKKNNSLDNLEKVTGEENILHYRLNSRLESTNLSYAELLYINTQLCNKVKYTYTMLPFEIKDKLSIKDFLLLKLEIPKYFK